VEDGGVILWDLRTKMKGDLHQAGAHEDEDAQDGAGEGEGAVADGEGGSREGSAGASHGGRYPVQPPPPPPSPRTKWTRRVPHPILIGQRHRRA
jgi:hypothetical protein